MTTLSKLPDLALLEVFANVPLLDMFRTIPLVCGNWHRLQRPALLQRKRLYLVPVYPNDNGYPWIRHLTEDVLGEPGIEVIWDLDLDWCLAPSPRLAHGDRCTTGAYLHNTLPLPAVAPAGGNGIDHMRALSSAEAVQHLTKCLPNITELTVVRPYKAAVPKVKKSALFVRHLTQLIRCYSSKLTLLRLRLSNPAFTVPTVSREVECLVSAINNLPLLHSLQLSLGSVQLSYDTQLSDRLLNHLRLLVFNLDEEYNQSHMLRSENLNLINKQEHLYFVMFHRQAGSCCARQPHQQLDASHLRLLRMNIRSIKNFSRVCAHFRNLMSLEINLDEYPFSEVLPALATLPALTRLCLIEWKDRLPPGPTQVTLPGLRLLSLWYYDHGQIDHLLLHTSVRFPALEHLHFHYSNCSECEGPRRTKSDTTCVQTMLSHLKTCPSLRTLQFDLPLQQPIQRFSRTNAIEAFRLSALE